jgi:tRNA1Val (adenine37-N6)-methyltransferase
MANSYFKFKQFTIYQDKCAMKVGTDAVLLGAWARVADDQRILDIGTGTGILALMLAQRSNAFIDAVEIDEGAFKQACFNVRNSKWSDRIHIFNISLEEHLEKTHDKYDMIICNPPYFSNSFTPRNVERSLARHTITMSFPFIVKSVVKLLHPQGMASFILPAEKEDEINDLAGKYGLFLSRLTHVKPNYKKEGHRILIELTFENKVLKQDELVIEEDARHQYTKEYIELTKEFYLNF